MPQKREAASQAVVTAAVMVSTKQKLRPYHFSFTFDDFSAECVKKKKGKEKKRKIKKVEVKYFY